MSEPIRCMFLDLNRFGEIPSPCIDKTNETAIFNDHIPTCTQVDGVIINHILKLGISNNDVGASCDPESIERLREICNISIPYSAINDNVSVTAIT